MRFAEGAIGNEPVAGLLLRVYALHAGLGIETPGANFAGNFGAGDVALLLALAVLTASASSTRVTAAILAPLALGVISTLSWAVAPLHGLDNFYPDAWGFVLRWFSYAALMVVLPMIVTDRRILWSSLAWFALGATVQVLLAWVAWSREPRFQWFGIPLLGSEIYNANSVGFYLSALIPVLLALIRRTRYLLGRIVLTAVVIGCVLSAFFTASKATWATVAFVFAALVLLHSLRRPVHGIAILALLVGCAWGMSQLQVTDTVTKMMQQRWEASSGSNLQRVEMIEAAALMATDYPALGAGPKSYQSVGVQYGRHERDPHNVYVWLAAEIGLLGALVFILSFWFLYPLFLVRLWRRGESHADEFVALGGPLIAVLLQAFVTGLPASDKASWLLLGLASIAWHLSACPARGQGNATKGSTEPARKYLRVAWR